MQHLPHRLHLQVNRQECCELLLYGNSELHVRGATLRGGMRLEVADGYRLEVTEVDGKLAQ